MSGNLRLVCTTVISPPPPYSSYEYHSEHKENHIFSTSKAMPLAYPFIHNEQDESDGKSYNKANNTTCMHFTICVISL